MSSRDRTVVGRPPLYPDEPVLPAHLQPTVIVRLSDLTESRLARASDPPPVHHPSPSQFYARQLVLPPAPRRQPSTARVLVLLALVVVSAVVGYSAGNRPDLVEIVARPLPPLTR
jgi:hypothetical protein